MKPLLYALLIFFCCSCTAPSCLESALLQSGANRPELEKVLSHYKDEPLKYRAACFLIEHMPGKYSLEAERADDPYRNFLRHIPAKDSINWKLDSYLLAKLYAEHPKVFPKEKLEWAAKVVLEKKAKVESTAIRQMREEVKKMLEEKE